MLKKTSALGGLVIAATAGGILLTGSPASAAVPAWHHGGRWGGFHATRVGLHSRNVNLNRNHNRVIVAVRVHNVNRNIAVARNDRFRRDGLFGRSCCRRGFDGDGIDGFGFGRFGRFFDGGATAIIGRNGEIFAHGD